MPTLVPHREKKTETLLCRVPVEMKHRIEEAAGAAGVTFSTWLRVAIEAQLHRQEKRARRPKGKP
jgi:predicted DNA-binding protein